MSIIRSNIARQLLAEGGAPRKPFANGGFDYESAAAFGNEMGMTSSPSSSYTSGFEGSPEMTGQGTTTEDTYGGPVGDNEPSFFQKAKNRFKTFETDSRMNRIGRGVLTTPGAIKSVFGLRDVPPELLATLADDYTQGGLFSEGLVGGDISLANAARTLEGLQELGVDLTGDIRSQVGDISRSKFAERFGPKTRGGEGGDNEPIIKKLRAPITEDKKEEPKNEFEELIKFYSGKFEDGGEVRQKYGLGSIVKKATRAVKKVAKSPVGKLALIGGLGFLANKTAFGGNIFKSFKALDPIKQALILGGGALTAAPFFMGQDEEEEKLPTQDQSDPAFRSYLAYYGGPTRFAADGGDIDEAPMKMASAVGDESDDIAMQLFGKPVKDLNPAEMKELQDEIDRLMNKFRSQKPKEGIMMASNIENERILENLFEKYLDMGLSPEDAAKKAMEEFDRMSMKEDMGRTMAAEGGMMNLGGNEMDLRGGGFVPIGAREKADDVPARLSKNEFVFTADAVRAAGGGSVDRGADLMYKTMKQLENKVV